MILTPVLVPALESGDVDSDDFVLPVVMMMIMIVGPKRMRLWIEIRMQQRYKTMPAQLSTEPKSLLFRSCTYA